MILHFGNQTPEDLTSKGFTPEDPTPECLTPEDLTPEGLTPEDQTHETHRGVGIGFRRQFCMSLQEQHMNYK